MATPTKEAPKQYERSTVDENRIGGCVIPNVGDRVTKYGSKEVYIVVASKRENPEQLMGEGFYFKIQKEGSNQYEPAFIEDVQKA